MDIVRGMPLMSFSAPLTQLSDTTYSASYGCVHGSAINLAVWFEVRGQYNFQDQGRTSTVTRSAQNGSAFMR